VCTLLILAVVAGNMSRDF